MSGEQDWLHRWLSEESFWKGCPFRERMRFVLELLATMPGKRLYRTSKHPTRGRYAGFIQPW